jgi:hypothetical protein
LKTLKDKDKNSKDKFEKSAGRVCKRQIVKIALKL